MAVCGRRVTVRVRRGLWLVMMVGMAGRGVWGRTVAFVVGLLVLIGLATAVMAGLSQSLQTAANVAGVVAAALALPLLVAPLWRWWRRGVAPMVVTPSGLAEAAEVLAGLVAVQWRAEAVLRSLDDPDPIPVCWRLTARVELMDHPVNLTAGAWVEGSSAAVAELAAGFREMRRRRLVIVGAPGSGKTTLAVQLLRHLLDTRRDGEPVPVLVSLSGWDVDRFPRLAEWMAAELERGYPALRAAGLGRDLPRLLASRGQILPVLDGLDELSGPAQAAVIGALNRSLADGDQLILTSRTPEYAAAVNAAADVLTSAMVIEPEPLTPQAAADYLERCLPPGHHPAWRQILAVLRTRTERGAVAGPGAALGEIVATPLGLWLLRTVYLAPGADPAVLVDPARFANAAVPRAHLFDHLIEALIQARPPPRSSEETTDLFRPRTRHDPARVRRRLGFLAHHLAGQGTRDFAWWRLAATTNTFTGATSLTLALFTALAFGLPVGTAVALADGLSDGLSAALADGLVFGLVYGLMGGLTVGRRARSWARDTPGYTDLRIRQRPAGSVGKLAEGLVLGLLLALTAGLLVGIDNGPAAGLVVGLLTALPGGLVIGLIEWAETPAQVGHATAPMGSWRADRALNLLRVGTPALLFGLVFGLAFGLTGGPASGFTAALTAGLPSGLTLGLAGGRRIGGFWTFLVFGRRAGRHRAWLAYLVATWRLARAGLLPRRLMPFLDDCHRLGLLRAVGPIYQFRHAELHDHLAAGHHPTARERRAVAHRQLLSPSWRLFSQLLAAMVVGTIATNIIFANVIGFEAFHHVSVRYPTQFLLASAAGLTIPVVAWMLIRGKGWQQAAEMAAAIVLPVVPFLGLLWLGVSADAVRWSYRATTIMVVLILMHHRDRARRNT